MSNIGKKSRQTKTVLDLTKSKVSDQHDTGLIFSPGYPNNYQHHLLCDYIITARQNQFVVLQFDDSNFRIEGKSVDKQC